MEIKLKEILRSIPQGHYFDIHVVIEKLLDDDIDLYRRFVADKGIRDAHAEISCWIRDSGSVKRAEHQSYSRTANGTYDSVACWLKN